MIFIAFLRGINLAGRKMIAMAELRALFDEVGLGPAQSLLQSGNIVFKSRSTSARKLEQRLERATLERFNMQVDCIVRSSKQLEEAIDQNPFPREAKADPSHLLVFFLRTAPSAKAVQALTADIPGRERARVRVDTAYIYYPDGVGSSKFTSNVIERRLTTRGTARNWNTVQKLKAIADNL